MKKLLFSTIKNGILSRNRAISNCCVLGNSKKPPEEPYEGLCCGQGCNNCVWIEYGNGLIDYYQGMDREKVLSEICTKVKDPNVRAFVLAELTMAWKKRNQIINPPDE
ncbi:unnamed protein product [Auanema sp. JU1783]|nr:unnamed protein product [Auanema sp. JU1783]